MMLFQAAEHKSCAVLGWGAMHCKYLRPNYDQIAAYGRTTTVIPWFQPLVVGCQSIFIVDIGIKEKYRIQY